MDESNIKHVKVDKLGSHDAMQSSHGNHVYSSRSSYQTVPKQTDIAVPETNLHTSLSISYPPMAETNRQTIIPPSTRFNFLQSHMENISSRIIINRDFQYLADL